MIFVGYFLVGGLFALYEIEAYRFQGPQYQAPEATRAVNFFKEKCIKFNIENVCAQGFKNLVKIEIVDKVWYQLNFYSDIKTIGLTEFSIFTPLTKISIDRRLTVDNVLLDTTIIHELGHAIFNLEHDDSKVGIMNEHMNNKNTLEENYDTLVNEMFKDFVDSKK